MRSVAEIFSWYEELDAQGRHLNGTDKNGPCHQYGDAYESLFMVSHPNDPTIPPWSIRGGVKLMMEVGVADGSSLLAWREVFPNALCVGMDIHEAALLKGQGRIEFSWGDQTSQQDCERAAAGRQFDFICEDATHRLDDSLRTLLFLWPFVRPGGLYVVEEFEGISGLRANVRALWPFAELVEALPPKGDVEYLTAFRKPK